MPVTKRRQISWMSVSGRYSAMRRTTSAAFTSALSVRNGVDACPGVPLTRSVPHQVPFSPTMIGSLLPVGVGIGKPPASVMT